MGTSLSKVVLYHPQVIELLRMKFFQKLMLKLDIQGFDSINQTYDHFKNNPEINYILVSFEDDDVYELMNMVDY